MLLESVLAFLWAVYLFETYLDYRQRRKLYEEKLPSNLQGTVSEEKYSQSRLYSLDKSTFDFYSSAFSQCMKSLLNVK
jgi:STE24 endopeptidase